MWPSYCRWKLRSGTRAASWHATSAATVRSQSIYELEHYLDVLVRKPGALAGSTPLAQWREKGRWPTSYDELWSKLNRRHGKLEGTRQMVELVQLGREHGYDKLREGGESSARTRLYGC